MTWTRVAGKWRRTDHEGRAPDRSPAVGQSAAPLRIVVTFHPMRETTLATVITRQLNGHDRWDRRDGTWTVDVPMRDIAGQDLRTVLRALLAGSIDSLS